MAPHELIDHAPGAEGTTYAVIFDTGGRHEEFGWNPPLAFPGIRLPQLAAALRATDPERLGDSSHLLILRALVAEDEDTLSPALHRCFRWPGFYRDHCDTIDELSTDHPTAHQLALRTIAASQPGPADGLVTVEDHLAYVCLPFGHEPEHRQWFFFDDIWAGSHPDLAASMVHAAFHWDPRCDRPHGAWLQCGNRHQLEIQVSLPIPEPTFDSDELDAAWEVAEDIPSEHPQSWSYEQWVNLLGTGEGYGPVIVRDYEPGDESDLDSLLSACDAAPSEPTWDRRLLILKKTEVIGVVEAGFPPEAPERCDLERFLIHPGRHRRGVATAVARRLCGELQVLGVRYVTMTLDLSRPSANLLRAIRKHRGIPADMITSYEEERVPVELWLGRVDTVID
ncbi:GNAT family N-acetyltransferase [Nonomuraea typhae]|uniref:GNAT family N-acetyltransferase n=1 Tax=Nonomuraea typhae TaxID=2603600 RepID=UPI0012F9E2B5|nr:GNAT family N-acetyltransferase [Nonomuraea typhae]